MYRRIFSVFTIFLLTFSFISPISFAAEEPKEDEPEWLEILDLVAPGARAESASGSSLDVRVRIAHNLQKILKHQMTAEAFYRELAFMKMPDGLEPRHLLMQVKRDLIRHLGQNGATAYLGLMFPTGGSNVEIELLSWRRKVVFDSINEVLREFKGQDVIDGGKWTAFVAGHRGATSNMRVTPENFKVFFAGVGSWMDEGFVDMKFAGDIDFSFVSGNPQLAMAMKRLFEAKIIEKVGMSAEHFDTPATAHGMADLEVFIGRHGQAFAENFMLSRGKIKRIKFGSDLDSAQEVSARDAFIDMFIDAKLAKTGLVNLPEIKWLTEPGISLEMIRHFEHDIVLKKIYSELENYMKAAKCMKRSFDAVEKTGGRIEDQALKKFCDDLIANKKSPTKTHAEIIRRYYETIKQSVPVDVELQPSSRGQTVKTIAANRALIEEFHHVVKKTMWDNAFAGFNKQVNDLSSRISSIDPKRTPERVITLEHDLNNLREMMEIQIRVLQDSNVGVKEIPQKFTKLMNNFRKTVKRFYQNVDIELPELKQRTEFKFIEAQLKAKKPSNIKLAMSMMIKTTGNIHRYLDILDDTLLGDLRGEKGSWQAYLQEGPELYWAKKVNLFVGKDVKGTKARVRAHMEKRSSIYSEIEFDLNQKFLNNCVSRNVRKANQLFARSVQSSTTGQVMMKGMVTINLITEIDAYADAYYEKGWEGFAVEFFRRRVPGGNVLENVMMDRYGRAVWDTVVTFIPPLALPEVAFGIGEYLGNQGWTIYWSSELEYFYDELYKNAQFKLLSIEKIDDQIQFKNWKLTSMSLNSNKIDVDAYLLMKGRQVWQLKVWLRTPLNQRNENIPVSYDLKDCFLTGDSKEAFDQWLRFSELLRENIYSQDLFLVMIDEMKNYENVGPRLLRRYQDMFFARKEEIKLEYFKHIVQELEKRKSAKSLPLDVDLGEILKKLELIAKELKIEQEMDTELEQEMGGDLWAFYTWIRDYFKGIKREMMEQPDIWSAYEGSVRIAQQYLPTYKKILDSRKEAEEEYHFTTSHDFGQRLLTGRYFLDGNASRDSGKGSRWRNLRPQLEPEVQTELKEIKAKYVDDIGLDQDPESFDQKALGGITDHDMWKVVWKYIHGMAQGEKPGVWSQTGYGLAAEYIYKKAFGDETGLSMQQQAVEHHKFHKLQRDSLKKKFEEYYLNKKSAEFEEIEKLVVQAEKISREAMALCSSATSLCVTAEGKIQRAEREMNVIKTSLEKLKPEVENFDQLSQNVITSHAQAEEAGINIAGFTRETERLSLDTCKLTRDLKSSNDKDERAALYNQINLNVPKLKTLLQEANSQYSAMEASAKRAQAQFNEITKTVTMAEAFSGFGGVYRILGEADRTLIQVLTQFLQMSKKVKEIEKIQKKAKGLFTVIERKLTPIKDTTTAQDILINLSNLMGRLEKTPAQPNECIVKGEKQIELLDETLNRLESNLEKHNISLKEVQKKLASKDNKLVYQAKDKAASADAVVEITKAYIERLENAAISGSLCVAMAGDLKESGTVDNGEDKDDNSKNDGANDKKESVPLFVKKIKPNNSSEKVPGFVKKIGKINTKAPAITSKNPTKKIDNSVQKIVVGKDGVLRINGRRCKPENYINPSAEDRKFYAECDKAQKKIDGVKIKKDDVLRINGRRCWPRNYITPSVADRKFYGECDKLQKKIDAAKSN